MGTDGLVNPFSGTDGLVIPFSGTDGLVHPLSSGEHLICVQWCATVGRKAQDAVGACHAGNFCTHSSEPSGVNIHSNGSFKRVLKSIR